MISSKSCPQWLGHTVRGVLSRRNNQAARREGGDQGRQVCDGDLAGATGQGGAEGHSGPLIAEDWRQDPLPPGWHAPAADLPTGVRLQEPHCNRPALRLHPPGGGDIGGRGRGPDVQAAGLEGQHLIGGLGGQRLPLAAERDMARHQKSRQPYPPTQAARSFDAKGNGPSQCSQVIHSRRRGACLCSSEEPLRALHRNHRTGPGRRETDPGQPRLQFRPTHLR